MSVKKNINPVIRFDTKLMPDYKSVTHMINNGLVIEPDELIRQKRGENMKFFPKSNVFMHLKQLDKDHAEGYVIMRVRNKKQAKSLEKNIKSRIKSSSIFVRHWNQENQLKPETYFNQVREGVLIVVIVQRKAAMGNSISTEHLHFVYDYSPNAALSTIAQGLLGRCCGHGKKNHWVIVYTHYNHAFAFSLFEQGKMQEFFEFLQLNNIKPSQRSVVYKSYIPIYAKAIKLKRPIESRQEARDIAYKELKKKYKKDLYIDGTIATRFLSAQKNTTQRDWYLTQIAAGFNPVETRSIEKTVGKTAVFYDDKNLVLYVGHRIEGECEYAIGAKDKSFYTRI